MCCVSKNQEGGTGCRPRTRCAKAEKHRCPMLLCSTQQPSTGTCVNIDLTSKETMTFLVSKAKFLILSTKSAESFTYVDVRPNRGWSTSWRYWESRCNGELVKSTMGESGTPGLWTLGRSYITGAKLVWQSRRLCRCLFSGGTNLKTWVGLFWSSDAVFLVGSRFTLHYVVWSYIEQCEPAAGYLQDALFVVWGGDNNWLLLGFRVPMVCMWSRAV